MRAMTSADAKWLLLGILAANSALFVGFARAQGTDLVPRISYRLGFHGEILDQQGLLVVRVRPDSPATRLSSVDNANVRGILESGDIITHVDGIRIGSMEVYRRAMDASVERQGVVELDVTDISSGMSKRWRVQGAEVRVIGLPGDPSVRKVHFLFIGLTDDAKLGTAIGRNLDSLEQMVNEGIREVRLGSMCTIKGNDCTATNILSAVNSLPMSYSDSVFCHFSGHGAYDETLAGPDDPSSGHHFQIPSGNLMRHELWDALRRHNVRLTVLITDTCNVRAVSRLGDRRSRTLEYAARDYSALEELLLGYRGLIDISASDTGQYAWYDSRYGGWFTEQACRVLSDYNDWPTAFTELRSATERVFEFRKRELLADASFAGAIRDAMDNQAAMTPRHFVFDVVRDDQSLDPAPAVEETRTRTYTEFVPLP